jgi:hypothetical protein
MNPNPCAFPIRTLLAGLVLAGLTGCFGNSERAGNTTEGNTSDHTGWALNANPAIVDLVEGQSTQVTLTLSCTAALTLNVGYSHRTTTVLSEDVEYSGALGAGPQPDPITEQGRGIQMACTPGRDAVSTMSISAPEQVQVKTSSLVYDIRQYTTEDWFYSFGTVAVAVSISDAPAPPPTAAPAQIGNIHATPGVHQVQLQWDSSAQASRYVLERIGPDNSVVTFQDITAPGYQDSGVLPDTTYTYRVTAINALGGSLPAQTSTRTLAQAQWLPIGSALTSTGAPEQPSMVLDSAGLPVVAYIERLPGDVGRLFVKRFDGQDWRIVGDYALNAGSNTAASDPALALDEDDQPIVAFSQGNGLFQNLYVARFAAGAWVRLQHPAYLLNPLNRVAGSRAFRPAILYGEGSGIFLAWVEDGAMQIQHLINGVAANGWQSVLPNATLTTRLARPVTGVSLAFGGPYEGTRVSVAWTESDGFSSSLYVQTAGPVPLTSGTNFRMDWSLHEPLRPTGTLPLSQFGLLPVANFQNIFLPDSNGFQVALSPTVIWADARDEEFEVFPRTWDPQARTWLRSGGQESFGYGGVRLGRLVTATYSRVSSVQGFALSYEGIGPQAGRTWIQAQSSSFNQTWRAGTPQLALNSEVAGLSVQFNSRSPVLAVAEREFGATKATLRVWRYVSQ